MPHREKKFGKFEEAFLIAAHDNSSDNEELMKGNLCGCFHCEETFPPIEINEWLDGINVGQKFAFCPKCGIDSVLSSKYPIEDWRFLSEMRRYWFNNLPVEPED